MFNCFSCSPSFLQHLQGILQSCTLKLPFNYFNLQRDSLVLPHRTSRPSIAQTVPFDWVNHRTLIAFLGHEVVERCQIDVSDRVDAASSDAAAAAAVGSRVWFMCTELLIKCLAFVAGSGSSSSSSRNWSQCWLPSGVVSVERVIRSRAMAAVWECIVALSLLIGHCSCSCLACTHTPTLPLCLLIKVARA